MMLLFLFAIGTFANQDTFYKGNNFEKFRVAYNKLYSPDSSEYEMRKTIFNLRINEFEKHNADPENTWTKGVNNFADWTEAELKTMRGLKSGLLVPGTNTDALDLNLPLADELNWCEKGACTPVKNQGGCGSCWSFAGTESIESDIFVETGHLVTLSPQEYVDCSPNPDHCGGDGGCEGSTADLLFKYAASVGCATEASYPYTARDGRCKINSTKIAATIEKFTVVKSNDVASVMAAVNQQPLAVNVAANSWSFYSGGIVSFKKNDLDLDHVVQLVGYGSDGGKDYWVVRNSWGAGWGLKGFIRIERSSDCGTDKNNQDGVGCKNDPKDVTVCGPNGILYAVSYPTGGKVAA